MTHGPRGATFALLVTAAAVVGLPLRASAQQTPGVKWKVPATWNVDLFGGRTLSTLTLVGGDPAREVRRRPGWAVGATFGRFEGRRLGFNAQILFGRQRVTEILFASARPADYTLHFVEVPLLLRFDPMPRKDSAGWFSLVAGVGVGRRFHVSRTLDLQTTKYRWAMFTDAIVGGSVDLRRVIFNVEYFHGLTKFTPASSAAGPKHMRSLAVNLGYQIKRGPLPRTGLDEGWEVEAHGGAMVPSGTASGTGAMPPLGPTLAGIAPGTSTRRVSSWFLGDGAALFNSAIAVLGVAPPQLVPADRVLTDASVQRDLGAAFGVRFAHAVVSRVSAEIAFDVIRAALTITPQAAADIEASRTSFLAAFNGLSSAGFSELSVTATAETHNGEGRQIQATAGALVRLFQHHQLSGYARSGLGFAIGQGDASVVLRGTYQFRAVVNAPFRENDVVTIQFSSRTTAAGIVGGGIKYAWSDRMGLRIDATVTAMRNPLVTTLTAQPQKTSNAAPFAAVLVGLPGGTGMQWTNFNSTTQPSSLSNALVNVETFRGRGLQFQTSFTAGVYRRF